MNLQSIKGIGPATGEKLDPAGITTVERLADTDAATLTEKTGVPEGQLEEFIDRAGAASEAKPKDGAPKLLSGGNPQIAKDGGDAPYRPTSRPSQAGNATSVAASTRSPSALSPTCARPCGGTRPSTESQGGDGSSASIASRTTSR